MKILILGQGGREHALVKAFKNSPLVTEIHVLPGNDGMKKEAICHPFAMTDFENILQICLRTEMDFVFIGPEDPLVMGLADQLRERGILVVGPSQQAAMLEGSKIFSKEFMMEAKVPTAPYYVVTSTNEALQASAHFSPPYVLKADGLAAGKGVFICKSLQELKIASDNLFEQKILGKAGNAALLEKFEPGWELSYLVLTNGSDFVSLPLAQDHKRLNDNNEGPNTGGMGTIAPLQITQELKLKIEETIIKPSIELIHKKQFIYRGILFVGVMVTQDGPKVLEYNVRLGDPETQVILPLIDSDIAMVMKDLAEGKISSLKFKNLFSACVIMASPGYPDNTEKNVPMEGLENIYESSNSYLIHAGTKHEQGTWKTNGGRVLGALGIGSTSDEAIKNAYELTNKISWRGMQWRKDIGKYFTSST
ncbi:MAG: phosphoribosylamine--glycine ligase [Bdellovibrionaceae bacterium]|nr:phosphoribosylamine--glycine ligase [Pseudobdellovibrionaceae bacterium]NUM57345.1 phosphoribosylamine--glycine ligase [Pseudobdellovibrionaceae bacterium]